MTESGRTEAADRLSRISSLCTLALLLVIALFVLLDGSGAAKEIAGPVFVLLPLAGYASIGLISRTANLVDYQLAGRSIPAVFAGIAAGAEWTAAAIVLGAVGSLLVAGHDGRALVVGLTGGYILLAVLIAPGLRNLGAATLPDFMAARYGGSFVRLLAAIVLAVCSFMFAVPLVQGAAMIVARTIGLDLDLAIYLALATILLCAFPGGMRGVTATQVAQWAVLIVGCVALFVIYEARNFDMPAASSYDPMGQAFEAIMRGTGLMPTMSPRSIPFRLPEEVTNLELVVCLMVGTASLPHVLMRPLTTSGAGEARASVAWSLLFIALLVFALPSYVALSNDESALERGGVLAGLVAAISLTAMLAAASALALTIGNSLGHDIWHKLLAPRASARTQLVFARGSLIAGIALLAYAAIARPFEPVSMVTWTFSLAAAGFFPALVLGIWWARATRAGAICGIIVGFGLCAFYIAVSRYFPQAGVTLFGMSSLINPATGRPLVNVAQVLADAQWLADVPASAANPLASKVGWFDLGNTACGLLGVLAGFLTAGAVSLLSVRPSPAAQAAIDAVRTPTGRVFPEP
jgi:cation/acetate symporter